MDLNCLTWIVSLGMAEQRRLRATFVVITPLVSSLSTVTIEASTGGEESCTFHPWSTWDVLGVSQPHFGLSVRVKPTLQK